MNIPVPGDLAQGFKRNVFLVLLGLAHQAANDVEKVLQSFTIVHGEKCDGILGSESVCVGKHVHIHIRQLGKGIPEVFNKILIRLAQLSCQN